MKTSTEIIVRSDWSQKKETFIMFNYLTEHHALFIASVSTFVTIGSFLISMISFLNQYGYLRSWNITIENYVNPISNTIIYFIAIQLVLYSLVSLLSWKLEVAFISYFRKCLKAISTKYVIRYLRKKQRHLEKKIRLRQASCNNADSLAELKNDKEEILAFKKELKTYNSFFKSFLTLYKKDLWILLFVSVLLLLPFCALWVSILGSVSWHFLIIWALYSLMIVIWAQLNALRYISPCTPRKIKQILKYRLQNKLSINGLDENLNCFFKELPIKDKKRGFLSDTNLKELVRMIVAFFLSVSISFLLFNHYETKSFWIYEDQTACYAVIYQRPDLIILEKAEIENNSIKIYTNQVKYLSHDNCDLIKMEFDTVEKCTTENHIQEDNVEDYSLYKCGYTI